jgi:hypothetical protein
MELYHNDMSTCAQKVRLVLREKNLRVEHEVNIRRRRTEHPAIDNSTNGVVSLVDHGQHHRIQRDLRMPRRRLSASAVASGRSHCTRTYGCGPCNRMPLPASA